jgi:hypothetical protein
MMDANFSLKRLSRKKELVFYLVLEEKRIWVSQDEVELIAKEDKKAKEDMKKKGKGHENEKKVVFFYNPHIAI